MSGINKLTVFAVLASTLTVAACGGGSGGDSSSTQSTRTTMTVTSATVSSDESSSSSSSEASSSSAAAIRWSVYNASTLPTAPGSIALPSGTSSQFTVNVGTTANYSWVNAFSLPGDGTISLDTSGTAIENRSQAYFNNVINSAGKYPKTITFLTRVLPVAGATYDNNNRLLEFDLALADAGVVGARIEGIIRSDAQTQGIQINKVDGVDLRGTVADMTVPHIYQVSVTLTSPLSGTVAVYVDGNDTPVIGPVNATNLFTVGAAGDNYVRFGDGRAAYYRSGIDWVVWTASGAYTPSQLQGNLPANIGVTTGY
ncbi:MAG: hypothetical protein QM639_02480 [Rhodocyclaceae bacterium]